MRYCSKLIVPYTFCRRALRCTHSSYEISNVENMEKLNFWSMSGPGEGERRGGGTLPQVPKKYDTSSLGAALVLLAMLQSFRHLSAIQKASYTNP